VNSLKRTSDGGYLILGSALTRQIWIVKTDAEGNKQWEKIIEGRVSSQQKATFAMESGDGSYLVVGTGNAVEFSTPSEAAVLPDQEAQPRGVYPFAMKLADNGEVQWRKLLDKGSVDRVSPVCGIATADGYILVGTKIRLYSNQPTSTGRAGVSHPWIAKVDKTGRFIWERVLVEDQDGLYDGLYVSVGPKYCAGPILDQSGLITFALRIHSRPTFVKEGVRIVTGTGTQDKSKLAFLIVQIDQSGTERAKLRIEETVRSSLFPVGSGFVSGFVMVDNPVPANRRGIQRTWINENLKVNRKEEATFADFSFLLEAVVPDAEGGFHVSGYQVFPPNERGRTALGYLRSGGQLVGIRTFGWGLPSWSIIALAPGQHQNEVALLLNRDEQVKLLRLRFQD